MWSILHEIYRHLSPVWHWIAFGVVAVSAVVLKGYPAVKEYFELKKIALETAKLPKETEKLDLEVDKLKRDASPIRIATEEEIQKYDRVTAEIVKKILQDSSHNLYSSPFGAALDWVELISKLTTLLVVITVDRGVFRLKLLFSHR
jgi:FKBP-type peptidyl-prolyl cis-trans isomerase (trigger factor)